LDLNDQAKHRCQYHRPRLGCDLGLLFCAALVGLYSTLAGVLAFTDMDISAALNRELAWLSVRKNSAGKMRDLRDIYEATYHGISCGLRSPGGFWCRCLSSSGCAPNCPGFTACPQQFD